MRGVLAALAGAAMLGAAPAAADPVASASSSPAPEDVRNAMLYLDVLVSGLQSEKVEEGLKGTLVGCLYNNSLGTITRSMDKVIADNPGKIDKSKPDQLLGLMARICGFKPGSEGKGAAAPAPVAPPSGTAPVGR